MFCKELLCIQDVGDELVLVLKRSLLFPRQHPVFLEALPSVIGRRTTAWWKNRSAWNMKWGPLNITCWKHKWSFHNRGVTWDTPMARWTGSEADWIQKWRKSRSKKAEVVPALIWAFHLSPLQIKRIDGGISLRKERELDPFADGASENR